ncbi:MAG: PDZ domain-containing protein, partial [Myxococcota bacterium]
MTSPSALLLITLVSSVSHDGELSCGDLPVILRMMWSEHYDAPGIQSTVKQRSIEQFIEVLDPSKALLLDAEVAQLKADLPKLFKQIRKDDCSVLNSAGQLIAQRTRDDLAQVRQILGSKDFKLDEGVELILDADKRGHAKTPAERRNRLRALVHFQVSNYLLTGADLNKAKSRVIHKYELAVKRTAERTSAAELPSAFAGAYALGLDPHTSYFSPEMLANFQISMRLSLEGIGAVLGTKDGFTFIQSIVPGGQADKQNILRPKDKIIAVAQEGNDAVQVIDMNLDDVVKQIRGKKGTKVTLTILREGPPAETFKVTIVRDKVDVKDQAASIRYEKKTFDKRIYTIGVIDLPSFYGARDGRSSFVDVRRLVAYARKNNVDGLVIALYKNGGGLL